MKFKRIISFMLLFSFAFSIGHEYVYLDSEDTHCSIEEYIEEISGPSDHGDICDIHYEYHIPYLMPDTQWLNLQALISPSHKRASKNYHFLIKQKLYRPPTI